MKKIHYLLVLITSMSMLFNHGYCQEECYDHSEAYCDCEQACRFSASIPIVAVIIVGAIALLTRRNHSNSHHAHSHSSSNSITSDTSTSTTTTTTTSS